MSWSFTGVGKPAALKSALDAELQNYSGQSRKEFEQVQPHLKALLDAAHDESAVSLSANGHASFQDSKRTYANVSVELKQLSKLYA
jgi:hypothetical protein